ncbi:hypothetical protein BH10BAC2_BH10BAC2_33940 [soil metagenome]
MGTDAQNNQSRVAKDAYGMALYYYGATDYEPITKNKKAFADASVAGSDFKALYNGNIAAMGVNISSFSDPYLYTYTYDQMNRLTKMKAASKNLNNNNNFWVIPGSALNNYKESISYDANGNILTYNRYNASAIMDSLSYNYYSSTNRLHYVDDKVAAYTTDIHDQGAGNYWYDPIGNLTKDTSEHIDSIYWNVYGKIAQINKQGGITIKYTYDPSGNRISKIVGTTETWYVRDASGNVMSVYIKGDNTVNSGALSQAEVHLYGSSRLGIMKPNINVQSIASPPSKYLPTLGGYGISINFTRGKKFFEESNHLGNVLVTVSDKKIGVSSNGTTVNYYTADIVSANDYYPFGMVTPGRSYSSGTGYRYGFNGKENDNEVKGTANQQDYGMRIYDPRLGKFLSVDPIASYYPELTPYQFASNRPIDGIDLDGLEYAPSMMHDKNGNWVPDPDPNHSTMSPPMSKEGALGLVVTADIFLTRGWLTRLYMGSEFAGAFEHNRAATPEGRAAQDERSKKAFANTAIAAGGGEILGASARGFRLFASEARTLYNFGSKALGEMGEEALFRQYGTIKPSGKGSSMSTSLGARKPDGVPAGTTVTTTDKLFEAKVGFQNYSGDIVNQVAKDAELIASGKVNEITWVFYRSPSTGKVGAADDLLGELQKAGIKTQIAGEIPKDIVDKAVIQYGATPKR